MNTMKIVLLAGVLGLGTGMAALAPSSSAGPPECWVDVYNDFEPLAEGGGVSPAEFPVRPQDAVDEGLRAVEADQAESRSRGDGEDVSADPDVARARLALYANARPGIGETVDTSTWEWNDDGRTNGVIVLRRVSGTWRVLEEHVLVRGGTCGA